MALNLSTDHNYLTFMGYVSPIDALDISNSNTPGVVDPTNPVGENVFRAVVQVDQTGTLTFTKTNAYSGNNGRAAILNNTQGANVFYASGNAGNGSNPQPNGVILAAGAQIITPGQSPRNPRPVGSFNITQLGDTADKIGKDTNFRGLTIFDNVVVLFQGQRRQRYQHRLLYRYHRPGVPQPEPNSGHRSTSKFRKPANHRNCFRVVSAADGGCGSLQYVRAEGISLGTQQNRHDHRLSVRRVVCERYHSVRRRRR